MSGRSREYEQGVAYANETLATGERSATTEAFFQHLVPGDCDFNKGAQDTFDNAADAENSININLGNPFDLSS